MDGRPWRRPPEGFKQSSVCLVLVARGGSRLSNRVKGGQQPPRGQTDAAWSNGSWLVAERMLRPSYVFLIAADFAVVGETRQPTLLVADPPTALAVTAEGASCAARAVPSDSVSCMLAARRVPTDRLQKGKICLQKGKIT